MTLSNFGTMKKGISGQIPRARLEKLGSLAKSKHYFTFRFLLVKTQTAWSEQDLGAKPGLNNILQAFHQRTSTRFAKFKERP